MLILSWCAWPNGRQ